MSFDVNLLKFLSTFKGDSIAEKLADMESVNGNGDGTLLKKEFMNAVHDKAQLIDVNDWNGECTGQRDLIDKWWKSLDTIQNTKKIEGSNGRFNEINALSNTEIEKFTAQVGEIDWAALSADMRTDVKSSSISDIRGIFTVDLKPLLEAKEHYNKAALEKLFGESYKFSTEDADGFNAAVTAAIEGNYKACLNADKSVDYNKLDVALLNSITDEFFFNQSILDKMDRQDMKDLYDTRINKIDSFDDPNSAGDIRDAAFDCIDQVYNQYDSEYLDTIFDNVFGTRDVSEIANQIRNGKIDVVKSMMDDLLDGLVNDKNLINKPEQDYKISLKSTDTNIKMNVGSSKECPIDFTIQRRVGGREKGEVNPAYVDADFIGDSLGAQAKVENDPYRVIVTSGDNAGTVTVRVTVTAPDGTTASFDVIATINEIEQPKIDQDPDVDPEIEQEQPELSDSEKRAAVISRFGELESSQWGDHSEIENGRVIRGDKYSDDGSHIWDNNLKSMYDRHDAVRLYYSCNESGGNWDKVCSELRVRLKEIVNYVKDMMSGMFAEYDAANITEYQIDQIVDKFMSNHKSYKCNISGQISDVSTDTMNYRALDGLKTYTNCVYEAYETVGKASHMYVVDFADIVDALLAVAFPESTSNSSSGRTVSNRNVNSQGGNSSLTRSVSGSSTTRSVNSSGSQSSSTTGSLPRRIAASQAASDRNRSVSTGDSSGTTRTRTPSPSRR